MDSDLWISRLLAAKRQYALHRSHNSHSGSPEDRLGFDELEVEEELHPDFSCPYCYEDHDIASLCAHLEDEHPFESRVVVCPVCSDKVQKDLLNHITLQHGHLFKLQRRQRLRRITVPSSQALSLLGRDLQETYLKVLLAGGSSRSSSSNASNAVSDSLLSSLVLNFPTSEAEETVKPSAVEDTCFKRVMPSRTLKLSLDSSLSLEERERRLKQAAIRASFVQHLLASTLFGDYDESR